MGRGGTGKTSFVALMTKYLTEMGATPILLIDADPDQSLGDFLGVDLDAEGKKTISELLVETFLESGGTTVGVPPWERIEGKIWESSLCEGESFDLIAIGPKWIEGCYCLPNAALKRAIERLTKPYRNVIVDSPAGLEHLNRRITSTVDIIFDIIDPSKKALDHVKRAYRIVNEVKIEFRKFYVVGGYRFPEPLEQLVKERTGLEYLGKIALDRTVEEYTLSGRSLLEIPESSPAYQSVKEIVDRAGIL
ncbi:MAG: CO dehydrogenase maturation factor [Candidatus Bathyarchaeota archaeon B26-2]|nr:MAG: CO dehydrogenase maturation factor [Candidatus Bathyarchaeota archaeon B26-2]